MRRDNTYLLTLSWLAEKAIGCEEMLYCVFVGHLENESFISWNRIGAVRGRGLWVVRLAIRGVSATSDKIANAFCSFRRSPPNETQSYIDST